MRATCTAARRVRRVWLPKHKQQRKHLPCKQCGFGEKRGSLSQNYMHSCISYQSSSSSGTWTEPPSRSAVRCDPIVSLLVTGVGWDSLPLGSGDLIQSRTCRGRWAGSSENKGGGRGERVAGEVRGQGWGDVLYWKGVREQHGGRGSKWIKKKKRKTKIKLKKTSPKQKQAC